MHFGENQLSPGSLGISPLPTGHPDALQRVRVRPSTGVFRPLQPAHGWLTRFRVDAARLLTPEGIVALSDSRSLRLRLLPGLASPRGVTRRLILQKARRHQGYAWLRPAVGARFQDLFHSPRRGAFHRSLTVLVRYRSPRVFSLGWWSTPLPAGFRVSGGTHAGAPPRSRRRRLRDSHPLRWPVPAAFG
jgi:hypothetical protein